MTERIRPAGESDLDAMAALAAAREAALARAEPPFPEFAAADQDSDPRERQRTALARTMEPGGHVALVAEDGGRVIGFTLLSAFGPIPGRPADEPVVGTLVAFDVEPERWPTAGPALLRTTLGAARAGGIGLLTASSTSPETEKRRLLADAGLQVVVEAWWRSLEKDDEPVEAEGVRIGPAAVADVDAMVAIETARRAEGARRDPGAGSLLSGETQEIRRRVLTEWVESPHADVLIAQAGGRPVGYMIVMDLSPMAEAVPPAVVAINGFDAEREQWPTAGRALLHAALDAARARGAEQVIVHLEALDPDRRAELEAAGMTVMFEQWMTALDGPARQGAPGV